MALTPYISSITRRCDSCRKMFLLKDLRTVLVQDETGYARLQFCQRCRVTR